MNKIELIYPFQFGFRQKHSTAHALIYLTEKNRKQLDDDSYGCGIFVNFQKTFDTKNRDVLLKKLEPHGIRGINNK